MADLKARFGALDRRSIYVGLAAATIIALTVSVASLRLGSTAILRSDAQHFYRVALDPLASDPSGFEAAAYRYGRPLYPFVAWMLALGRDQWILTTLAIVYAGSYGVLVWLGSRLTGRSIGALSLLLAPSVIFTAPYLVSEPFVLALVLATYLLAIRARPMAARLTGALVLLGREVAIIALVPLIAREARTRGVRKSASWLLIAVPIGIWWTWIRVRLGVWPFADPDPARSRALSLPFVGVTQAFDSMSTPRGWLVAAIAIGSVTLAGAVTARFFWAPRSVLATGALSVGALLPFFGYSAWSLGGEAIRLMMPAQIFVILTALSPRRTDAQSGNLQERIGRRYQRPRRRESARDGLSFDHDVGTT